MADDGNIVAMVTCDVTTANITSVTELLRTMVGSDATSVRGFIEGRIVIDESRAQVIVFTEWDSRETWAQAEWDERISRGVAELYKQTASYHIRLLFPVAKAKGLSIPG